MANITNITLNITEDQLFVLQQALGQFKASPEFRGADSDIIDSAESLSALLRDTAEILGI